jgi:hypothetical protein
VQIPKKHTRTRYAELLLMHPVGSAGYIVCILEHPGCETSMHYFFKLGCVQCGSHKKRVRTRCAKLVFLYSVGSVGHVAYSGLSVA